MVQIREARGSVLGLNFPLKLLGERCFGHAISDRSSRLSRRAVLIDDLNRDNL